MSQMRTHIDTLLVYKICCCECSAQRTEFQSFVHIQWCKLTNLSLSRQCAGNADTKVGPLVQVNLDRSKNLNEVFLKVYFISKFIQNDIKFSNQWTRRHVNFLVPMSFAEWSVILVGCNIWLWVEEWRAKGICKATCFTVRFHLQEIQINTSNERAKIFNYLVAVFSYDILGFFWSPTKTD